LAVHNQLIAFAMLALLLVFLIVSAVITAKMIVWALVERPSLYEIKNVGIFGITGVILATVVGLLMGVTGNFWIFVSAMFVACLVCFSVGDDARYARQKDT
jgi:hypothetical protein